MYFISEKKLLRNYTQRNVKFLKTIDFKMADAFDFSSCELKKQPKRQWKIL